MNTGQQEIIDLINKIIDQETGKLLALAFLVAVLTVAVVLIVNSLIQRSRERRIAAAEKNEGTVFDKVAILAGQLAAQGETARLDFKQMLADNQKHNTETTQLLADAIKELAGKRDTELKQREMELKQESERIQMRMRIEEQNVERLKAIDSSLVTLSDGLQTTDNELTVISRGVKLSTETLGDQKSSFAAMKASVDEMPKAVELVVGAKLETILFELRSTRTDMIERFALTEKHLLESLRAVSPAVGAVAVSPDLKLEDKPA